MQSAFHKRSEYIHGYTHVLDKGVDDTLSVPYWCYCCCCCCCCHWECFQLASLLLLLLLRLLRWLNATVKAAVFAATAAAAVAVAVDRNRPRCQSRRRWLDGAAVETPFCLLFAAPYVSYWCCCCFCCCSCCFCPLSAAIHSLCAAIVKCLCLLLVFLRLIKRPR